MSYKDLQTFIKELKDKGDLICIDTTVSADLEITEIADRVSKAHGKALLFTNVRDSKYSVLINAMGSYGRMSTGLGVDNLDEIGDEIEKYLDLRNYLSIKKLFKSIPRLIRLLHVFPIRSKFKGKCQEVIEKDVNLHLLPVLKCWPEDAGKFITLPLVFTKSLNSKQQNVGMYRMQILDETTTGMHWHKHKDGSENFKEYKENNLKMPVSVALGGDVAITYSATAPLPKMLDEMMLAGFLRKSNVKMVKSITNDIYVPANAEIILEGYVDPNEELVLEGPFGDHTGYYSLADYYPKFHVTCITHKKNAIYPTTIVGKPPMEDCYMAKATERIFLPMLKMIIPELVDLNLPFEGVFHNLAIVSIKNKYPGCPQKIMNSIWGMGQMMYTKSIIVVDEDIDIQDLSEVKKSLLNNVHNENHLVFSLGPLDALDHSSNEALFGTRIGIDATAKSDMSGTNKINDYKIITINKERPHQGREELEKFILSNNYKFVFVVDSYVDINDLSAVFWKILNNIDAKRDIVIIDDKFGIDGTDKIKEEGLTREWPNEIVMCQEIKDLVEGRWNEYGVD